MSELPNSWDWAELQEIATVMMGQSPPSSTYNTQGKGLPFFQGKAEFTAMYPIIKKWCSEPLRVVPKDAILLSVRAPVGPTNLAPESSCIGRGLAGISPNKNVFLSYLLYSLRFYEKRLARLGTGTTFSAISGDTLRVSKIPVAPFNEQRRIVAKLEELFSDLDAATAALERVRANLKRYRASVLKSAVEGKLTTEWRVKNPPKETGAQLLERILVERRARWEENQLAKFKAQGKEPPNGWREKYPDPAKPDSSNLPELPDGWVWASLDTVAFIAGGVTKGQKYKTPRKLYEAPYLRVANVQRGYLDLSEMKTIMATKEDLDDLTLRKGDILFNEGGDRDKLGRGWIWEGQIENCIHQNHVFRARVISESIMPKLISYHGNTFGRDWFLRTGKQSVNLASINMTILKAFPVPIAPIPEQQQIDFMLNEVLSDIDKTLEQCNTRSAHCLTLRQAVLKQAFEGKLVPQNPSDEPASELLKRIQEDRQKKNVKVKIATEQRKSLEKQSKIKRKSKKSPK